MNTEEKEMMEKLSDRTSFAFAKAAGLEQDSKSPEDDPEVEEAYQEYEFLKLIRNKLEHYFELRKSVQLILKETQSGNS